ncbi:MAG: virulence RhuM family protein [Bacteroidia bacterium]|nr:virulence RhuM family protein [Bacteroidia bacterium]
MKEIEIYRTKDGKIEVDVRFEEETVWLRQGQLEILFATDRSSITKHLRNIFISKELDEKRTCAKFAQVQTEGDRKVKREVLHYNLDAIISVGYRVNSKRGTQFRQWATQRLKEYLVKGYSINQKRLDELGKMVKLIEQSARTDSLQMQEAS